MLVDTRRILIAANRLPVTVTTEAGAVEVRPSSGGLATALSRVRRRHQSLWIGWTGLSESPEPSTRRIIDAQLKAEGMVAVHLSRGEVAGFYRRYANEKLWPILHDMTPHDDGNDAWQAYRNVNVKFADAIARELQPGDLVWVHDYHLMLVPRLVRQRCPWARIGFFLHTPFPSVSSFASVEQAATLLDGLLGADVIGVHTREHAGNFVDAIDSMLRRPARDGVVRDLGRDVRILACPISVDTATLGRMGADRRVAAAAAQLRGDGLLFAGVDRLDYTKGIPQRLRAFEQLLEAEPGLVGRVRLLQIAVPSREDVGGYARLRAEVESLVARINERWAKLNWKPIDYRFDNLSTTALAALYRAADVMLVTPLRDGMNLVAKEFVATRVDGDGMLVLSKGAGAAAELSPALLVEPENERALTDACLSALNMLRGERRVRMRRLRSIVANHDVFRWADRNLSVLRGLEASVKVSHA
jgi:trehalose 6-phosphate synthase/phosphatase